MQLCHVIVMYKNGLIPHDNYNFMVCNMHAVEPRGMKACERGCCASVSMSYEPSTHLCIGNGSNYELGLSSLNRGRIWEFTSVHCVNRDSIWEFTSVHCVIGIT